MKKSKKIWKASTYFIYKETLIDVKEHFWSFIGTVLGLGIIAFLQTIYFGNEDNLFLIGSFGATCVLLYAAIQSPLAQPRNLIGGHLISAFVGVAVFKLFPDIVWLTAPLAVALSILFMQMTKTLHPPGGATALIAVTGSVKIKALGFYYVLFPVLTGVMILFLVALVVNNLTSHRKYPTVETYTRKIIKKEI